jgi:tetratricopeptide (TPR) repeat protein
MMTLILNGQNQITKNSEKKETLNKQVYTIQIGSYSEKKWAELMLSKFNKNFQKECGIYTIKNYDTLRCRAANTKIELESDIQRLKNEHNLSPIVVLVNLKGIVGEIDSPIEVEVLKTIKKDIQPKSNVVIHKVDTLTTSVYEEPKIAIKIMPEDNSGSKEVVEVTEVQNTEVDSTTNLNELIKKYEVSLNENDNEMVRSNLFYLYGKTLNWERASKLLQNFQDVQSVLYAYGIGAIESNSQSLEIELHEWLEADEKGYLNLLLGVYKEKQKDNIGAFSYYEKAYKINQNDLYLMYSYARSLELINRLAEAKEMYRVIHASSMSGYEEIKNNAYNCFNALR